MFTGWVYVSFLAIRYKNYGKLLLIAATTVYLSYHFISGSKGVLTMMAIEEAIVKSREELDLVNAERLKLRHRVSMLSDHSLDRDLLDERARFLLGYADSREKVVYLSSRP